MSEDFDSMKAGERVSDMWLKLAEALSGSIPEMVGCGDALDAIRMATYAEACFWKATGDADTHDVKDVLGITPAPGSSK